MMQTGRELSSGLQVERGALWQLARPSMTQKSRDLRNRRGRRVKLLRNNSGSKYENLSGKSRIRAGVISLCNRVSELAMRWIAISSRKARVGRVGISYLLRTRAKRVGKSSLLRKLAIEKTTVGLDLRSEPIGPFMPTVFFVGQLRSQFARPVEHGSASIERGGQCFSQYRGVGGEVCQEVVMAAPLAVLRLARGQFEEAAHLVNRKLVQQRAVVQEKMRFAAQAVAREFAILHCQIARAGSRYNATAGQASSGTPSTRNTGGASGALRRAIQRCRDRVQHELVGAVDRSQLRSPRVAQHDGVHQASRAGENGCAATDSPQNWHAMLPACIKIYFMGQPRGAASDDHQRLRLPEAEHFICARIGSIASAMLRSVQKRFIQSQIFRGRIEGEIEQVHVDVRPLLSRLKRSHTHWFSAHSMSDTPRTPGSISAENALPPIEPPSAGFLVQLFVIPGVIVAIIVVVWLLFHWLASMGNDPREYIKKLRGNSEVRWQAAVNLAGALQGEAGEEIKHDGAVAADLGQILEDEIAGGSMEERPINLRIYLCRALGEFKVPQALPPLLDAAKTQRDEKEIDVRRSAVHGLAALTANLKQTEASWDKAAAIAALIDASKSDNPDLRLNRHSPWAYSTTRRR